MSGGSRWKLRGALVVMVAVTLLAGACASQGGRNQIQPIAFEPVTGDVTVEFEYRTDSDDSQDPGNEGRDTKEMEWEESISLQTEGFIYHPNLLELSLGGVFGMRQFRFEQNDDETKSNGSFTEYDIEGTFFKSKAYPLSFLYLKRTDIESRQFAPSIDRDTERAHVSLRLVHPKLPTVFSASRTLTTQGASVTIEDGSDELDLEEKSLLWNTDVLFGPNHTLNWSLIFFDSENRVGTRRKEEETEIDVRDSLTFGAEEQYALDSILRYRDRSGITSLEQLDWTQRLNANHTENFRTHYWLDVRRQELDEGRQDNKRFTGAFNHSLYGSLLTHGNVYATAQSFPGDVEQDEFGGLIGWDYTKKNPVGVLKADLELERIARKDTGPDSTATAVDEAHTLVGTTPDRLDNIRVILGTVVVTDLSGFIVYIENSDYILRSVGSFTEIERIIGGNIGSPETVLATYDFTVGGAFDTDTSRWLLGFRQDFNNGLSFYVRRSKSDQDISDAPEGVVPEDMTTEIVGTEYTWRDLTLRLEHEDRDSTVQPVKTLRLGADYSSKVTDALWLRGSTGFTRDEFRDVPKRTRKSIRGLAGLHYRRPGGLTVISDVIYTHNDDDMEGTTEGFTFRTAVGWSVRQVDVALSFEHNELSQDRGSDRSDDTISIALKRSF